VEISSLKIGMMQSGEFVLVWIERFNKESHLQFQYYSKNAIPVGKRMRVNKISLYKARYPSIATNSLGELVVTWTNWHNGYPKVYFQLFSSTKLKKGLNSTITDQIEKFNQHHSSVAFWSTSNFILAWCDDIKGEYNKHIFAQKFSTDGTKVKKSRKVSLYKKSYLLIVSSSGSSDYIIVWTCYLFKYPIILGQTYSAQDKSISGNFEIESKNLEPDNNSVSMNKSGNFVVS